ncbi:MAG: UDP-N-acetylmuramate--L-alanine ligase [Paludibacteraceae bacterium]|nr:UDP-N-acetylmuramate--L-alanine ligase [Paludibacteraceae bacterium]
MKKQANTERKLEDPVRVIISGGGTGGHIFPAISIAGALAAAFEHIEFLFVGAEGRMEMEKVPAAGYKIVGLPIQGLYRSLTPKNLTVLKNAVKSIRMSKKIIREFQPDVVVGVGGYASAPVLWQAASMGIPTLIQEQNSYAGITNKILSKRCDRICVAYDGMDRFFPAKKIVMTGNPVRKQLLGALGKKAEAYGFFGFNPNKKTLLIIGGSLGARTINESMLKGINALIASTDLQVIWQTGKFYFDKIKAETKMYQSSNLIITDFVSRMDLAYSIADLVVSRAGASSISELSLLRKPCLLVPSPNVSEDHQRKNAMALVERGAAEMILDADALFQLVPAALKLIHSPEKLRKLSEEIAYFARPKADREIAVEIAKLIGVTLPEEAPEAPVEEAELSKTAADCADKRSYYFLGIGGIGMSALARYLVQQGHMVGGYDRTPSALTETLEAEGIHIHYEDNISKIPVCFMDPEKTTVVRTPAVPEDMSELVFFKKGRFNILKRAQLLGEITAETENFCIAGTHGKTTTTTLLAHLLRQRPEGVNAFLGGISKNYDSNLLVSDKSHQVVVEADEYDRSFLQLRPHLAVVTATDADHLDIYGTKEAMLESFAQFTSLIREGGSLICKAGIDLQPKVGKNVKVYSYSGGDEGDFHAENIQIGNGEIRFDFVGPDCRIGQVGLGVPVKINVENAVAAMAAAHLAGMDDATIAAGVQSFAGTRRRFDFQLKNERMVYIDDYAHHPNELAASIDSIRSLYPDKRICGIFQPHLYSRTRDFAEAFGESLSKLDAVALLDIYPAREAPIKGVSSNLIYKAIHGPLKKQCKKEQLFECLDKWEFDVLVSLGAGDIDRMVGDITRYLENRINER